MATVLRFEDLDIWKLATFLAKDVFLTYTKNLQFYSDYQLKQQINDSFGSIMDNIAEGFERGSRNEFINFLSIAKASAAEVQSQLYRALDREYLTTEKFEELYSKADEIIKKTASFIKYQYQRE